MDRLPAHCIVQHGCTRGKTHSRAAGIEQVAPIAPTECGERHVVQTANALRRRRNATRHLEPVADANDATLPEEQGMPMAAAGWSDADTPDGYTEQRELRTQVRACFARALERYPRARLQLRVVWLHVIEDQTYEIIAKTLSMRVENVRVLFSRGVARLRSDPEWQALFND